MNRSVRPLFSVHGCLALLLVAHLLATVVLEASPRLHHWVHPNEDHDDDCAVVAFLHGGCDLAPLAVVVQILAGTWEFVLPIVSRPIRVAPVFAASCILEHAPPHHAVYASIIEFVA